MKKLKGKYFQILKEKYDKKWHVVTFQLWFGNHLVLPYLSGKTDKEMTNEIIDKLIEDLNSLRLK